MEMKKVIPTIRAAKSMKRFEIFLFSAGLLLIAGPAGAAQSEEDGNTYFENHIRPILVERCYQCHSEESGKRKGGLLLDRRAGWETGGDSGPAPDSGRSRGQPSVDRDSIHR